MNDEKDILNHLLTIKNISLDSLRNSFVFPINQNESAIEELIKLRVVVEDNGSLNKEIDLETLPYNTFLDETDFLQRVTRNSWGKPIFIFHGNIFYDVNDNKTYRNNVIDESYLLVNNNFFCFKFLNFLKTQEHQDNSAFYFVDYLNWDSLHLVLTSLIKDGKIEILLPQKGINISDNVKIQSAVSEFINAFNEQNKHYPKFIKIELIKHLASIEKSKRLEVLFRSLNEIIYLASQNFEIYLHELSLENLKNDFFEYKNKYFIQLRDVLSKLTYQIIGLPIAITASVFAAYKVSDSNFTLFIIIGVFYLYFFYTIFLLKLQKEDIADLKENFNYDFNKIKTSKFFIKFSDELPQFERIKNNLHLRIQSLTEAIDIYYLFFSISTISFTIYGENQMKLPNFGLFITALILVIGSYILYRFTQTLKSNK